MEHPIGDLMQTAMSSIKDLVDVNTVIGEPVQATGGATIIPISKVSFGYVTAGGDLSAHEKERKPAVPVDFPFAGGSGAGVSVQPVGFLADILDELHDSTLVHIVHQNGIGQQLDGCQRGL